MALPPRAFFNLYEAAARWDCTLADIAGWATTGLLQIVTSATHVHCGGTHVAGLVEIPAADMMPMFRRFTSGPEVFHVHRVRAPGAQDWMIVTEPAEGLAVQVHDLLITAQETERFETEHELAKPERRGRDQPPTYRYDWDGMYLQVIKRVYEQGLPDTQREFISEMEDWFIRRSEKGDAPGERSIRRRIQPIWQMLREAP